LYFSNYSTLLEAVGTFSIFNILTTENAQV